MKRLLLLVFSVMIIAIIGIAQTADEEFRNVNMLHIGQDSSTGIQTLSWWGKSGRNYFLQQTDDLHVWNYIPIIEPGADQLIQWGFVSNANKGFFRLQLDLDQDGLPDSFENTYFGENHGVMDPNGLAVRGDGLTNIQACLLGLNPLDRYNLIIPQVKPTVTLSASPSIASAPATVTLTAAAATTSGSIARVDFYQDGGYVLSVPASSPSPSFSATATLPNLPAGNYAMSAVAVDMAGVSSTDSIVSVALTPAAVLASGSNRYDRGQVANPYYHSAVVAVDNQVGVPLDDVTDFVSLFPASKFPNGYPWFIRTSAEPNYPWAHVKTITSGTIYTFQINKSVSVNGTTIGGSRPLVAFGSQGGGTPLYVGQTYNFGVLAGLVVPTNTNEVMIEVYKKSSFANNANNVPPVASGTFTFTLPKPGTSDAWKNFEKAGYVANFSISQPDYKFDTFVRYLPGSSTSGVWGQPWDWPFLVSHRAYSSDYYFKVNFKGNTTYGTPPVAVTMARDSAGRQTYNLTYSVDFDDPSPWQSAYITQPHFQGVPLPSAYQGKTVDELIHNAPPVSGTLNVPMGNLTTIDNSPELRSHPVLDNFVSQMGGDPMALANYVLNEIELTDAMGYGVISGTTVQLTDKSINPTGVSRSAFATFMEGQGSPAEQCALLVYLLRKAGTPCGYVFPSTDSTLMFDQQMSKLLRIQLRGAKNIFSNSEDVPQLIPVNYPWVAAYIGGKWVHIFPWLKDTAVEEGYDLWDYMQSPTSGTVGMQTASQWIRAYLLKDPTIRSLSTERDNPGTLFPLWVKNQLQTNYPGMSMDDLGIKIYNRRNYYTKWDQFPRPWQTAVVSGSNFVETLSTIPNIFDTLTVKLYKDTLGTGKVESGQQVLIDAGTMRLVDLHSRRFLLYHQALSGGTQYKTYLSLEAYRPNATAEYNFTNDPGDLLNRQVNSAVLSGSSDRLLLRIDYQRHRQLPSGFTPPAEWGNFLGFGEALSFGNTHTLHTGEMAAICLNYGRVSEKMQEFQAEKYWNYQKEAASNTSLSGDPERSTGTLLHLMGLSYYYKFDQFRQTVEGLTKTHAISSNGYGVTKLTPGTPMLLNGDIDLRYPVVDIALMTLAAAGNGTSHLDSGDQTEDVFDAMQLLVAEGSADEHLVINEFFQQNAAVSTVKLLDIAQVSGTLVELDASNYTQRGADSYKVNNTTQTLAQWATASGAMWSTITSELTNPYRGPLTSVLITPGPQIATAQQGQPYTGMGAFIISPGSYYALISNNMVINGGFGGWNTYSIPSYNPPRIQTINMCLTQTASYAWTLINLAISNQNQTSYTPPVYSNNNFSIINNAVSTNSMSFLPDVSDILIDYLFTSGMSAANNYSMSNTGSQAAAANQSLGNSGYSGHASDYRNMSSSSSSASSNGSAGFLSSISDPVNVMTGEFYSDTVDLKLDGPMPLEIRRNYSSINKANNNFGYGWRMGYFPYLVITDTTASHPKITASEMDGSVIVYAWDGNESVWKPTVEDNPNLGNLSKGVPGGTANVFNNRITFSGTDTYTLAGVDGSTRVFKVQSFDQDGSGLNRRRPYLQSWTDSRGNSYTFSFGNTSSATDYGQVNRIQSSNGNYVGFYYDIYGHITEAYTGDGRRLYYNYDNFGDLIQVTLPDASTVNYDYQHLPVVGTGLTGTYFAGEDLKTQKYTRTDATVNFSENTADPALIATGTFNNYSIRWTGLVLPKYSDTYTFFLTCDDGARLWVNGKLVIDQWSYNGGAEVSGSIALVAGQKYDIRVDYHEATNGAFCKLMWSSAHQLKEIIQPAQLFPTTNPVSVYSSHLLTQETKPDGRILQNDYDSRGRVLVQRSTAGAKDALVTTGSFGYANSDITLANGSFETPVVASGTYQTPSSGASWTFAGKAYIQSNGSAWGAAPAPDGSQTAVLQGAPGVSSTIAQAIFFPVNGSYNVTFNAAQRANYGGVQPIKFSVDGVQVGGLISPSSTSFALYQTGTFNVTSGTHTIQFSTTDSTADKSSFIDGVGLVSANGGISGATTFVDALSHTTTYTYASSQITQVNDPSGYAVIQEWYWQDDANGGYRRSLKKRTDKRGLITEYKYDSRGNLKEMSVKGNLTGGLSSTETATTFMEYNTRNLLTSSTDALGNVTGYVYGTGTGRLYLPTSVQKSAPGGVISTTVLDYEDVVTGSVGAYGVLKKQTVAAGTTDQAETNYGHNANGFITSITKPTGTSDPSQVINYGYNLRGELVEETDELGRTTNYAYDGRGNRIWTEWHDEDGTLASWQYNYYNRNGEIEWTQGPRYNPDDYVLKRYDAAGRLSEETKWRSEANDAKNGVQAPKTADAAYATAFYIHDATGNLTEIRDTRHNSTAMLYNSIGQMTNRKVYAGGTTGTLKAEESFGYEPGGEVTTYVNPLTGTTSKFYTSTGKVKEQDIPDGSKLYWQYDLAGRITKETLRNGNYWVTQYDDFNRTVTRTLYSGATNQPITSGSRNVAEISQFDRRGNAISRTDLEGNTFLSTYDALNRVKATAGPSTTANTEQQSVYHTYGAGGKVHIVSDALKQNTYTLNDTLGRPLLVQVKDRANKVVKQTSYVYAPDFNSVTVTQGIGNDAVNTTTYTDTYGNPVLVMRGGAASGTNAKVQRFDYDNAGNLVKSTDEQGLVTLNTYDALNHLTSQTLPGGAYTSFILDAAGNQLERHMPGGHVHYQVFDSASRKKSEYLLSASGTATRNFGYSYYTSGDWTGLSQTTTDPRGITFTATYDSLLRPSVVTATGGQDAQNQSTTYSYDWLGRVTSVEQHYTVNGGGFTSGTSTLVQRTYDGYGQILTEQVSIDGVATNQFSQSWDGAGRRVSLLSGLTPQGNGAGLLTSYEYRADNLIKQMRVARGNYTTSDHSPGVLRIPSDPSDPSIHNFVYNSASLLTSRENPWRAFTVDQRDAFGRVTSQTARISGTAVLNESFIYRDDSKIDTYTVATTGTQSRHYSYNDRGQLLSEPTASGTLSYEFDGNTSGTGAGVRTLAKLTDTNLFKSTNINGWQQVQAEANVQTSGTETVAWTYDATGAVTSGSASLNGVMGYTWDAFGHLVSVHPASGPDWLAVYDGLGRRLRVTEPTATSGTRVIESYYDPQVEFLELGISITTDGQFISRTWLVYGPDRSGQYGLQQGIGGLEATIDEATSTVTALVNDAFGNTIGRITGSTLTPNAVSFGAYGPLPGFIPPVLDGTSVTVAQACGFLGHRTDSTGYYQIGVRPYGPLIGRFLAPDPLGHAASISLYDWANNDPVNNLDPDGRCVTGFTSGWNSSSINTGDSSAKWFGYTVGSILSGGATGWGNAAEINANTMSFGYTDSHGFTNSSQYQGSEYNFSRTASGAGWAGLGTAAVIATGGAALEANPGLYVGAANISNSTLVVGLGGGAVAANSVVRTEQVAAVQLNRVAGQIAESQAARDLVAQGNTILGSQVAARTSQGLRIIDHLIQTPSGAVIAVEVKSGNAVRNASQLLKDTLMATEGAVITGKNAPDALRGTQQVIKTIEMRY